VEWGGWGGNIWHNYDTSPFDDTLCVPVLLMKEQAVGPV